MTAITVARGEAITLNTPYGPVSFKAPFNVADSDVLTVEFAASAATDLGVTNVSIRRAHAPFFTSYAKLPLDCWPFGTTVRHVEFGTIGTVLTDDGLLTKVLMLPRGEVVETGHSIWEPDRA